jgi:imidazole glycerol-phosphate synthase subunit HisF
VLKRRVIPCILLRNGVIVQSKQFKRWQLLGNPTTAVRRLSDWAADELVYLDISAERVYDLRRDDLKSPNRQSIVEIIRDVAEHAFMPLTFGGGIRTMADVADLIASGADKVAINTQALAQPDFIGDAAREFGSQCIVVSVDVRENGSGGWEVFADRGKEPTGRDVLEWVAEAEQQGAGEIFLNSIDRDGTGRGYDLELVAKVVDRVTIPVIACGGVGRWEHFAEALEHTDVSAVSAANIFHYTENSVRTAKTFLSEQRDDVRAFEGAVGQVP